MVTWEICYIMAFSTCLVSYPFITHPVGRLNGIKNVEICVKIRSHKSIGIQPASSRDFSQGCDFNVGEKCLNACEKSEMM